MLNRLVVCTLLFVGIYFTFKFRFLQIRKLPMAIKAVFSRNKDNNNTSLSPFEALSTALGGTMGTGNIVGVGIAISIGGAGAIFWMWVSAILGMIIKYVEVYLSIYYQKKEKNGELSGGPMYYIEQGLGKKYKILAIIFALGTIISSFGIGNITQVNAITNQINITYHINPIITAILIFIPISIACLSNYKSTGKFSSRLVPLMSLIYISMSLITVYKNRQNLFCAIKEIFAGAFSLNSFCGGGFGYSIKKSIGVGFSRGIFSNEAGMGSSPIAHGSSNSESPYNQGLLGIFEVFTDTIVMCTITALAILTCSDKSGLFKSNMSVAYAMEEALGERLASFLLTVCIIVFAYTSILSWCFYGCKCCEYIASRPLAVIYKLIFCSMIVIGSFFDIATVWKISDILNLFMLIPNLIAITLIVKKIEILFTE